MEVTEQELQEVERMGAAAFTPTQTAFALGYAPSAFGDAIKNEGSPIAIAYYKGLYSSELAIRESAFLLARSGSSPAQTLSLKYFDETHKTIMKDEYSAL